MASLRIAVFVEQFPSISQTFVLGQVRGLLALGHEVTVFAAWGDSIVAAAEPFSRGSPTARVIYHGDIKRSRTSTLGALARNFLRHPLSVLDAINVFRHGRSAASTLELTHYLHWMGEEPQSFDVLYCHFGPSGRLADRLRRAGFIRGKLVTVFHAFDLTRYVQAHGPNVYRGLFKHGDVFIAITQYARRKLLALSCPSERITILHAGVDCANFSFRPAARSDNGVLRVLCIGRMVEKKGFEYALHALKTTEEHQCQVRVSIAGDGPLLEALKQQARDLGLEEVVTFLGPVSHARARELANEAHIMLVPSVTAGDGDEEGLPAVILEALATGTPVIATRHAGIPEAIRDHETGLLVKERDASALATAIQSLVDNQELCAELSHNGRAFVETNYDEGRQTERLVTIFEDLLST